MDVSLIGVASIDQACSVASSRYRMDTRLFVS